VTVVADACVRPPPVRRDGARAGDAIWASGPLGAAAAALARLQAGSGGDAAPHARPRPRTAEGIAARELGATAMIDVSDGLGADLGHVLDASGVGCALEDVPVAPGATWEQALGGGEDFELVWCAPDDAEFGRAFAGRGLRPPARLGRCTADQAARTVAGAPLPAAGWQHRVG
jgi:thiamine-monophosphate kinase